jgi:hypothetical protein
MARSRDDVEIADHRLDGWEGSTFENVPLDHLQAVLFVPARESYPRTSTVGSASTTRGHHG